MSALTLPYTAVANQVAPSASYNANNAAIVTWSTEIDNTNIGSAGIFASQIKPLTATEAQFGATATGVGYKFLANDSTATPLTVSGVSGQTADIFDVTLTSGGTDAFKIGSTGAATFGFALSAAGLTSTAGVAAGGAITGATTGAFSGAITGATSITVNSGTAFTSPPYTNYVSVGTPGTLGSGALQIANNSTPGASYKYTIIGATGTNPVNAISDTALSIIDRGNLALVAIDTSGNFGIAGELSAATTVQCSSNGSTRSYVPPVYTAAGAATASTLHIVSGTTSASSTPVTVTLSGAAAFSSSSSYIVVASTETNLSASASRTSGTAFNVAISSGSTAYPVDWIAIGT